MLPCVSFPSLTWWKGLMIGPAVIYTGPLQSGMGYRNRYQIATAAGTQLLSIPIIGGRRQAASLDKVHIDYTHAWQRQHWRTLMSAYGRAPFFEHYSSGLESLLLSQYLSLLDFNMATIEWLRKEMQIANDISPTTDMSSGQLMINGPISDGNEKPYHQVFEDRFGFIPDLSAIDLLMNEGPYGVSLL